MIAENAIAIAKTCATYAAFPVGAMAEARGSRNEATVGSPIQPNASEARVIPSWVAEMKNVGLSSSRNAAWARVLPAAARVSRRGRRTETRANSAATKNPLAQTKNSTANNFAKTIIRVEEC